MVDMERKKIKFKRQQSFLKRLKDTWRKPKGRHSKMRQKEKGKSVLVAVGWGSPKTEKYLHPCGLKEVLVRNVNDLKSIDPKEYAVRISGPVGKLKKMDISAKAKEMKIKVLNAK